MSIGSATSRAKFGADMLLLRGVVGGGPDGEVFRCDLSDGTALYSRCVLCATGVDWRRVDAPGVDRLMHAGVYYGSAISEAPGLRDKDVFIIGGGNSAGQAAMNFAEWARSVTLVVRRSHLAATMSTYLADRIVAAPNVQVLTNAELSSVDGDTWLRTIAARDNRTGRVVHLDAHAVFIWSGSS